VLLEQKRLYGDDTRPLIMSPEDSLDIDSPWQLRLAELLLRLRDKSS
jgi:CMP-N-acetylneuraminic acid synthetase